MKNAVTLKNMLSRFLLPVLLICFVTSCGGQRQLPRPTQLYTCDGDFQPTDFVFADDGTLYSVDAHFTGERFNPTAYVDWEYLRSSEKRTEIKEPFYVPSVTNHIYKMDGKTCQALVTDLLRPFSVVVYKGKICFNHGEQPDQQSWLLLPLVLLSCLEDSDIETLSHLQPKEAPNTDLFQGNDMVVIDDKLYQALGLYSFSPSISVSLTGSITLFKENEVSEFFESGGVPHFTAPLIDEQVVVTVVDNYPNTGREIYSFDAVVTEPLLSNTAELF